VLFWVGLHTFKGSARWAVGPIRKKTSKSGLDPVHGFNAFSVGLSSSPGTFLGPASSATTIAYVHSSSPLKVSSPTAVVEKFSAAVPQQVAMGCSSVAISAFSATELLYLPRVDMGFSMGCSSGIGLAPSVHWNSSPPGGVVFDVLECFSQV
jgi:hypothetical protein